MHNLYVCPHCGHHKEATARGTLAPDRDETALPSWIEGSFLKKEQLAFPGEESFSRLQRKTGLQGSGCLRCSDWRPFRAIADGQQFFQAVWGQTVGEKITRPHRICDEEKAAAADFYDMAERACRRQLLSRWQKQVRHLRSTVMQGCRAYPI